MDTLIVPTEDQRPQDVSTQLSPSPCVRAALLQADGYGHV